jgi:hypothetical protein
MAEQSYKERTVPELRAEIARRGLSEPDDAKKADLIRVLEENDAAPPDGNAGEVETQAAGEGDEPNIGVAFNVAGQEIAQVGKHPDLPPDVPVQAGTALDPALPPREPQQTRTEPEPEPED